MWEEDGKGWKNKIGRDGRETGGFMCLEGRYLVPAYPLLSSGLAALLAATTTREKAGTTHLSARPSILPVCSLPLVLRFS